MQMSLGSRHAEGIMQGNYCKCQCQAEVPGSLRSTHGRGLPATEMISQTHHLCLRSVSNPGTLSLILSALRRRAM